MLIAKVFNNSVLELAEYQKLFPNVSFPESGPDAEFLAANSCVSVSMWKAHDSATQRLVQVEPYVEDNIAYLVVVVEKTLEEQQQEQASRIEQANMLNEEARIQAYRNEADPLFFKAQRGEATKEAWLAKVAEIKARYPTIQ